MSAGSDRPGAYVEQFKAKVVLVGAHGVGKTSLVRRYVLNQFDDYYRITVGANVYKWAATVDVAGHPVGVTMTMWDTMGEDTLRQSLLDVYLRGSLGVLAVCDVSEEATVPALAPWIDASVRVAGDVPVEILMNKVDLGARPAARDAGLGEGRARAAACYLTSAKGGDNVTTAFEDLARRIVERTFVPAEGPLDEIDGRVLSECAAGPRSVDEVARRLRLPPLGVEARLERLRKREFVALTDIQLDAVGRPRILYTGTGRPTDEILIEV